MYNAMQEVALHRNCCHIPAWPHPSTVPGARCTFRYHDDSPQTNSSPPAFSTTTPASAPPAAPPLAPALLADSISLYRHHAVAQPDQHEHSTPAAPVPQSQPFHVHVSLQDS